MELFVPIEFENIEGVTDWKDCSYTIEVILLFLHYRVESGFQTSYPLYQ